MAKTVVEEFVARLGIDVPASEITKMAKFEKSLDGMIGGFAKLAAAATAAVSAFAVAMSATNRATWQQANLAKAFGMSAATLENFDYLLDEVGLGGEDLLKSFKALSKGIGGNTKAAGEALKTLGLSFSEMKKLAPGEQFLYIMNAAQKAADGQTAAAAASKLLGREASTLVGWARLQTQSIGRLLREQAELNFMTDDARDGAGEYSAELDNITDSLESMWKLLSGLVGKALAPYLKQIKEWIKNNRELISQKINEWVDRLTRAILWLAPRVVWLVGILRDASRVVGDVIGRFGGFENVLKLLLVFLASSTALSAVIKLQSFVSAIGALTTAAGLAKAKMLLLWAAFFLLALVIEDVYGFFHGKDSLTGDLLDFLDVSTDVTGAMKKQWGEEGLLGTFKRFRKEAGDAIHEVGKEMETIPGIGGFFESWNRIWREGIGSKTMDTVVDVLLHDPEARIRQRAQEEIQAAGRGAVPITAKVGATPYTEQKYQTQTTTNNITINTTAPAESIVPLIEQTIGQSLTKANKKLSGK